MQRAGNQPVRVLQARRPSIIISFYKNEQMLWNLVGLDQLCYECNLSPNHAKFLSEDPGGCYGVRNMFVVWHMLGWVGGRQQGRGGPTQHTALIIWRTAASAGFCGHLLSYTRSLCQKVLKADKHSFYLNNDPDIKRKVLPTAVGHTEATGIFGKLFCICIHDKHIWKKTRIKASS